jgi:deoxyribodipyrimidine photo-lyase
MQQKKFDSDCLYIKKWIPELAKIHAQEIHSLEKNVPLFMTNYPAPIINHAEESKKTKLLYAHCKT